MENNEEVRLRKIPLSVFIDTLLDLFNSGVDYVDIIGKNNEEQDVIGISFSDDYMSKNYKENFDELADDINDEPEEPTIKNIKLSDEDLNQLL